jgi:hypothetical protein
MDNLCIFVKETWSCLTMAVALGLAWLAIHEKARRWAIRQVEGQMKARKWLPGVIGCILLLWCALYCYCIIRLDRQDAVEKSPVYQNQMVVKWRAEALIEHFYKVAAIYDTNQEERADFAMHDMKWLQTVTDDLLKEKIESDAVIDLYNQAMKNGGLKGETIKRMADELTKEVAKLPKHAENP